MMAPDGSRLLMFDGKDSDMLQRLHRLVESQQPLDGLRQ
jgi:hypothetical protein